MTNKTLSLFFIGLITSLTSYSQNFLNGDFEINSAVTDQINLTNAQYDNLMVNSNAFGNHNGGGANGGDVDIITSNSYCNSTAQQGSWYIALTGGGTDAISLELSSPLVTGQTYSISFYDRSGMPPATVAHAFQIGLSLVDTTFGALLYTAPTPDSCSWSLRSFSFVAPNNGKFITAKIVSGTVTNTWCHLDNFAFNETTSIQTVNQNNDILIFPNPAVDELNIKQIEGYSKFKSIRILNQLGQEISRAKYVEKINVSHLSNGMYFLEISTDKMTHVTKFMKK